MVSATVTGKRELKSLTIDPEAVDPEDVEMLQDMIVAAVNEALRAAESDAASTMQQAHRRARPAVLRGTTPHPPGRDRRDGALFYRWRAAERKAGREARGKAERRKK